MVKGQIKNDLSGKYYRLSVIGIPFQVERKGRFVKFVLTRCDCGVEKNVICSSLKNGTTKSCGCLQKEFVVGNKNNSSHNLSNTNLYKIFYGMKQRCYDEKYPKYAVYGARGISICDSWLNDFSSFYNWAIENGWKKGLQIDRIDNDSGYSPENCRIVTNKINCRNKSTNKLNETLASKIIELHRSGITQTKIAETYNVSVSTISNVVNLKCWN